MKALLARLAGADRPKVIAVFGATRSEVECGIRHARTSTTGLPVWAWCAEECEEVPGCERFICGPSAALFMRDLRQTWPALSIVAWTGRPQHFGMKILPLVTPPFRTVLFNEAAGFFSARPASIVSHIKRRTCDRCVANLNFTSDISRGAAGWVTRRMDTVANWTGGASRRVWNWFVGCVRWIWSLLWRAGERVRDFFNWIREFLFVVLALIAQPAAGLSYSVIRNSRRRRKKLPAIDKDGESGDGRAVEVLIPNRAWPRRRIVRTAESSTAEFLVFRMRGETASADSLIAIAVETGAFAVARQSAHAAWRRQAVHKHPFRRLQDGEVCEVFAPFSTLTVVRRDLLLRLGIPRALTFGAGLMILFWKSSASGLRSLVAGREGMIGDEPAMALEDAELALRLALSPALAAHGPEHPSRLRGNVSWSVRHGLPRADDTGRLRVLVVSPYLPFPLSHGGAVRIYNLCRSLARDVDFVLACFREAGETVCYDELHEVFREVYVVDADEKAADASVPKQIAEYRNTAMSNLIRGFCLERRVDLVQLEYTQLAEYRDDTGAVPVILVEHDITFALYQQIADFEKTPRAQTEYKRWLEFERSALQCSNLVWTMSGDERAVALAHGSPRHFTRVIPNGVDLRRFTATRPPAGPPVILFIGSFRHLPNLLAFEALRISIMPAVWASCPDAVLHVIGGPHHGRAAELAGKSILLAPDPRIHIDGFVADVRPAYQSATVVGVPLPLSAGTNIKLLEAMACGRAIVSTQSGCRGLGLTDGEELVIADLEDFAAALVRVLRDEPLRMRLARAARAVAELRFGWDAIAEEGLRSYYELTGTPVTASAVAG